MFVEKAKMQMRVTARFDAVDHELADNLSSGDILPFGDKNTIALFLKNIRICGLRLEITYNIPVIIHLQHDDKRGHFRPGNALNNPFHARRRRRNNGSSADNRWICVFRRYQIKAAVNLIITRCIPRLKTKTVIFIQISNILHREVQPFRPSSGDGGPK